MTASTIRSHVGKKPDSPSCPSIGIRGSTAFDMIWRVFLSNIPGFFTCFCGHRLWLPEGIVNRIMVNDCLFYILNKAPLHVMFSC